MNELRLLPLNNKVKDDPAKLAEIIIQLAQDIEESKNNIQSIKDRGFFEKIFANNTKDLADTILKQSDVISLFFNVVQSLIVFNVNNAALLGSVQEQLLKHEASKGSFNSQYLKVAKSYINQSYNSAKYLQDRIDQLENQSNHIERRYQDIYNMGLKINEVAVTMEKGYEESKNSSRWVLRGLGGSVVIVAVILFSLFLFNH